VLSSGWRRANAGSATLSAYVVSQKVVKVKVGLGFGIPGSAFRVRLKVEGKSEATVRDDSFPER